MIIKKVLLLGGTGTLSSAVLDEALLRGYDVTIMNRGRRKVCFNESVHTIICDFKNITEVFSKFKDLQYDVVVDFLSRQKEDIERIFPFFAKRCHQYIFISSACVYRRSKEDFPIIETSPKPNSNWLYNIQKFECEQKLIEFSSLEKTVYTIVRPYITYNDERIPLGIAPSYKYHRTIIERIKTGKPWFTWDGGEAITTLTHTLDFARAVVGLFLNTNAYNEDFHITSGFQCSQSELIEKLFSKLGKEPYYIKIDSGLISEKLPEYKDVLLGDRKLDAIFDNSKIKHAIPGFCFKIDIDSGLERVVKYWNSSEKYDYDYRFDARIDKLLRKMRNSKYINYSHAPKSSLKIYLLYRYFPFRIASKIIKYIL